MNPYFTIIVSVYNAEKYLREFLDSILAQTFTDWECICINDGSKDSSAVILDEYAAKDTRVKPIHKANEGVGKARNVGMDVATGRWVTWADADDVLAPSRLEAARRVLEKEDPDLLQMHFVMAKDMPDGFMNTCPNAEYKVVNGAAESFAYAWNKIRPLAILWLTFARRELYSGLRYPEEMRVKGDGVLCADLYPRIKKICHSTQSGYFYRVTSGSIFRSERKALDCLRVQRAMLEQLNRQIPYARTMGSVCEKALKQGIRNVVEGDVVDWIVGRKRLDKKEAAQVRDGFLAVRRRVMAESRVRVPIKYRFGLWLYVMLGFDWGLRATEWVLTRYRAIRCK